MFAPLSTVVGRLVGSVCFGVVDNPPTLNLHHDLGQTAEFDLFRWRELEIMSNII